MPYPKKRKGKIIAWMAEVRLKGHPRVTEQCRTKAEAQEREVEIKKELKAKEERQPTPTVLDLATRYLSYCEERFTDKTFLEKKDAMDILTFHCSPSTPVTDIDASDALSLLDKVNKKRGGYGANKTRKNLVAAWNFGFKYLKGWPQNTLNPFSQVETYPYEKQSRYIPPMEDVQKVLETMLENEALDDYCMLLCYLHTGARRSEILRLRPSDLDFGRSKMTLWTRKRKGGSWESDVIPMTSVLKESLKAHLLRNGFKERVFMWKNPLTGRERPYKLRRHWLEYWCGLAGVKRFSFHCIRHLTASWLDDNNVPLKKIQAILRHKSTTTTDRYLHELQGADTDLDTVFGKQEKNGKVISMGEIR